MFKIIGADQKEYGPISTEQIRRWITDGRLNAASKAQREGSTDWLTLAEFPEFADIFNPVAAPSETAPSFTATPAPGAGAMPTGSREEALKAVKAPAIALIVNASIGVVLCLLVSIAQFLNNNHAMYRDMSNMPPEMRDFMLRYQGVTGGLIYLFCAAMNALVLFGGLKMLKLESRSLVFAACIIAMLPITCCCCFIGIPFSIWALIVINKTEVKSEFLS